SSASSSVGSISVNSASAYFSNFNIKATSSLNVSSVKPFCSSSASYCSSPWDFISSICSSISSSGTSSPFSSTSCLRSSWLISDSIVCSFNCSCSTSSPAALACILNCG